MPLDTRVSLAPLLGRAKRENRCLSSFPIFVFMLVSVRRSSWSLSYLTQKLGTLCLLCSVGRGAKGLSEPFSLGQESFRNFFPSTSDGQYS